MNTKSLQPKIEKPKEKVLLFCPTYMAGSSPAIRPETKAAIEAMEARHPEIDAKISTNNPYPKGFENVLFQYKLAREIVLSSGYRALLCYEHDMLAPENGFELLDAVEAPVVYGLYMLRHGSPVVNAFRDLPQKWNIGMSLSHFPDELKRARAAKVWPVSGGGFGFTLMRREVLEKVEIRRSEGGNPIPDMPFAEDCKRLGFQQMMRMDCECGHFHRGKWIWPGDHAMLNENVNVLVLRDFVGYVGNQSKAMKQGDKVLMPEKEAHEYERAGYVRALRPVAVKLAKEPKAATKKTATRRRRRTTKKE